jgi:hypothetical protein
MYRTRERSHGNLFGSIRRTHASDDSFIDFTPIDMIPTYHEITTDAYPSSSGGYFRSEKWGMTSTTGINLIWTDPEDVRHVFDNYLPPSVQDIMYTEHIPPLRLNLTSDGGPEAVELLKRTNPSRASVSLPTFLGESMHDVKSLPQTIRTKGDNYASSLGVRFGILPFVSDVLKMTRLSEAVDKRSRELVRLNNKGGAHVKRVLEDKTYSSVGPADFVAGRDPELSGTLKTVSRARTWGVCRWIPDSSFDTYIQGSKANRSKIRKLLLGIAPEKNLSGYAVDAWNLIPFSWLGDWFGNFGDLLEANQNSNLAHPEDVCIMQHLLTSRTFKSAHGSVTMYRDTKIRVYPEHLQLTWSNPILSADQMLILSGLAFKHPRSGKGLQAAGGGSPPPIG